MVIVDFNPISSNLDAFLTINNVKSILLQDGVISLCILFLFESRKSSLLKAS